MPVKTLMLEVGLVVHAIIPAFWKAKAQGLQVGTQPKWLIETMSQKKKDRGFSPVQRPWVSQYCRTKQTKLMLTVESRAFLPGGQHAQYSRVSPGLDIEDILFLLVWLPFRTIFWLFFCLELGRCLFAVAVFVSLTSKELKIWEVCNYQSLLGLNGTLKILDSVWDFRSKEVIPYYKQSTSH